MRLGRCTRLLAGWLTVCAVAGGSVVAEDGLRQARLDLLAAAGQFP